MRISISGRMFAIVVAGIILAAFAGGLVAGYEDAEPPQSFSWDAAGVAATALSTLGLAIATAVLAWSTAGDVTASRDLAEIARAEHRLATEPFLIEGEAQGTRVLTGIVVSATVTIVNVGSGPALDVHYEVYRQLDDGTETADIDRGNVRVIRAGENAEVKVAVRPFRSQGMHEWRVRGTYVDRDGNPTARFAFGYPDSPRVRGDFVAPAGSKPA